MRLVLRTEDGKARTEAPKIAHGGVSSTPFERGTLLLRASFFWEGTSLPPADSLPGSSTLLLRAPQRQKTTKRTSPAFCWGGDRDFRRGGPPAAAWRALSDHAIASPGRACAPLQGGPSGTGTANPAKAGANHSRKSAGETSVVRERSRLDHRLGPPWTGSPWYP